jgi:type II secretory pathway predicted ATPase ExeA
MNLRQLVEHSDRVFPSHPQVGRYFPAAAIDSARRRLVRSIERGDGPCVVIGSAGTGKSLLLQVLAAGFKERFDVVLLACASLCTRRALLQAIQFELGLEYRHRDEGRLRLSLLDQLLAANQSVEGLLLLVDEAQSLPPHLIEELRVLTNLVRGGKPRVRLVLAGLPSLEETLAGPELESFSQRLAARCYLGNLTRDETTQYVRAHLAAASIDPDQLIAAEAWAALFDATDGVPRLVNQLCDQTLMLAAELDLPQIDRPLIQAAWAELQQLPVPWEVTTEGGSSATGHSSIIEFGALDADDADETTANAVVDAAAAGRLAPAPSAPTSSLASTAPLGAAPPAVEELEVVEPTELDEEIALNETATGGGPGSCRAEDSLAVAQQDTRSAEPGMASPPRRPRVFGGCVPTAIDPFADQFEEEELVLENFGGLSGIFHPRTPCVENRRNPAFAQLLDQAIQSSASTTAHANEPGAGARPTTRRGRGPEQPSIRLAVVAESTFPEIEHLPPQTTADTADADEAIDPDEFLAEFGDVIISRHPIQPPAVGRVREPLAAAASGTPPCPSSVGGPDELDFAGHRDDAGAILVIEEEAADVDHAGCGVRREEYRHLFSRLRHGTY